MKLLRTAINQAERAVATVRLHWGEAARALTAEISTLLAKAEKVCAMTYRREILGECVPNDQKLFSIYEAHTDVIVKGDAKRQLLTCSSPKCDS